MSGRGDPCPFFPTCVIILHIPSRVAVTMNQATSGTILIADISGYTLFLSQSELEHAQEILSTLLELLITRTRPPLVLSRTAGDAVISYTLDRKSVV